MIDSGDQQHHRLEAEHYIKHYLKRNVLDYLFRDECGPRHAPAI